MHLPQDGTPEEAPEPNDAKKFYRSNPSMRCCLGFLSRQSPGKVMSAASLPIAIV